MDVDGRQINRWRADVSRGTAKSIEETTAELDAHRAAGYRQFQIKVGADWAADIERIKATVPLLKTGEKPLLMPIRDGVWMMPFVLCARQAILIISRATMPDLRRMPAGALSD